jgi:sugar/nucleoside kinase (ribokinase family)
MTRSSELRRVDVVCLGIIVADIIARHVDRLPAAGRLGLVDAVSLHPGGCAINTAFWLKRLGMNVAIAGKVGQDALGDFLLAAIAQHGIDDRGVLRDGRVPTSATVVLVDRAGERTFLHVPGANGTLAREDLMPEALFAGAALHIGGALAMPTLDGDAIAEILKQAQSRGITTSLDTVWDPTGRWSRVEPCLPHLDLFCANLEEASAITHLDDPSDIAAAIRASGVKQVAVKLGADGSFLSGEAFVGYVEPLPVRAIDGTGAGDAFVAALLLARLKGMPLQDAGRLANAAGALATTVPGAGTVADLEELMAMAGRAK